MLYIDEFVRKRAFRWAQKRKKWMEYEKTRRTFNL